MGNTLMLKETLLENIINGNSLLASSPNKPFYRCVVGKNLVNNTFEVVSDNFSFLTEKNELEKLLKKVEIELSACNEQNRIIINSKGWRLLEKIRRILRRK